MSSDIYAKAADLASRGYGGSGMTQEDFVSTILLMGAEKYKFTDTASKRDFYRFGTYHKLRLIVVTDKDYPQVALVKGRWLKLNEALKTIVEELRNDS